MPSPKDLFLNVPFELGPRSELCESLVAALTSRLSKFRCTTICAGSSKPSVGLYATGLVPLHVRENGATLAEFGDIELLIEVNTTKHEDPFCDSGPELLDFDFAEGYDDLPKADQAKVRTLGRSVYHASQVFAQQHRLHFTL